MKKTIAIITSDPKSINYESDCFKIGLNLSKKFYQVDDIKKSNNLTLFFTLKPFGQPIAPNLSGLIKD